MTNTTLTKEQQKQKLEELISGLASDLKETVLSIERGIPMTQNHYGAYGAILSRFNTQSTSQAQLIALALLRAGANKIGVATALKLFC